LRQTRPLLRYVFSLVLAVLCAGSTVHTATTTATEHAQTARVQGVVLYHDPALGLFVQVGGETLQVTGLTGTPLTPGDRVEVTGETAEKDGRRIMSGAKVSVASRPGPASNMLISACSLTSRLHSALLSIVAVRRG